MAASYGFGITFWKLRSEKRLSSKVQYRALAVILYPVSPPNAMFFFLAGEVPPRDRDPINEWQLDTCMVLR